LSDTWEWDGVSWVQASPAGPPAGRYGHAMTFDRSHRRTLMCCGFDNSAGEVIFGDTWEWNGTAWSPAALPLPIRDRTAIASDSARRRVVLFGGYTSIGNGWTYLGDTWEAAGWPLAAASAFGSGCGSPPLSLVPGTGAPPGIGATAQAVLTNVPSALAFLAL